MGGAEAAVKAGLLARTELVLVAEPTALKPCLGQKGVLQLSITTEGEAGHASMPWAGRNAIAAMGRILAALRPLAGTTPRRASLLTASPDTVAGGVAMNVIADRCTLGLDVRYSPRLTEAQARARIEACLKRARVPHRLEVLYRLPALAARPDAFAQRLRALSRRGFGACDFATEAARFATPGRSFVICGPGLPQHCHVPDEWIEMAQVEQAVRMYVGALTEGTS